MRFSEYQASAAKTDKKKDYQISTFGLVYEAGSLLDTFQMHQLLRDKYNIYRQEVREDLGDILWYLSSIASAFNLKLSAIAKNSLAYSKIVYESSTEKSLSSARNATAESMASYQRWVNKTDIKKDGCVSVLGVVGEVGSVATIVKKIRRTVRIHVIDKLCARS